MYFAKIPGLENIKNKLITSVNKGNIAHAQMFSSIAGGGALPMALAYSTFLLCENKKENDACGVCNACLKTQKHVHPDLHYIYPVSSTKSITGADVISKNFLKYWREFIPENPYATLEDWVSYFEGENKQAFISRQEGREVIKDLSLKAFEGSYKIMLIWLPEKMHISAANSILKILEEPPTKTLFLLVTHHPEQIISTIQSRVLRISIRPFNEQEIKTGINKNLPEDTLNQIAHLSAGNMREAIRLSEDLEDDNQQIFSDWMRLCFKKDYWQLLDWCESFSRKSKIAQNSILAYGQSILRDSLMKCVGGEEVIRAAGKEVAFVENFAQVMSIEKVEMLNRAFEKTSYALERNANPKIASMDLSIKIATVFSK